MKIFRSSEHKRAGFYFGEHGAVEYDLSAPDSLVVEMRLDPEDKRAVRLRIMRTPDREWVIFDIEKLERF